MGKKRKLLLFVKMNSNAIICLEFSGNWFDYSVSPCHAPTNPSTHQASRSQREIIVLTENRGSTALKILNTCLELSSWCYVNKRWHHYFRQLFTRNICYLQYDTYYHENFSFNVHYSIND